VLADFSIEYKAAADRAGIAHRVLPLAAFDANFRVSPLKRTAALEKPMNGMQPEPEALRQSLQ
jgi:hypothetical protein